MHATRTDNKKESKNIQQTVETWFTIVHNRIGRGRSLLYIIQTHRSTTTLRHHNRGNIYMHRRISMERARFWSATCHYVLQPVIIYHMDAVPCDIAGFIQHFFDFPFFIRLEKHGFTFQWNFPWYFHLWIEMHTVMHQQCWFNIRYEGF